MNSQKASQTLLHFVAFPLAINLLNRHRKTKYN